MTGMMTNTWLIMVVMATVLCLSHARDSYVVLFPKSMSSTEPYTIMITVLKPPLDGSPVNGTIKALIGTSVKVFTKYTLPVARCTGLPCPVSEIVTLQIPGADLMVASHYQVEVTGFTTDGTFLARTSVNLKTKSANVFIQSDKGVYKPSQNVSFRVVIVDSELKPQIPLAAPLLVTAHDPKGNKIKQWTETDDVMQFGVFSGSFELSDEPMNGMWKIKVQTGKMETIQTFEVAEYVLPKFEVTVTPPGYILISTTHIKVTVDVKYTYGKPVKGTCTLVVNIQPYSWESPQPPLSTSKASLVLGKIDFDVTMVKDGQTLPGGRTYNFVATCTDDLTANVGEATVETFSQKFNLGFHELTATNYKLGQKFRAYVKLSLASKTPPLDSDLVCRDSNDVKTRCQMELSIQSYTSNYWGGIDNFITLQTIYKEIEPSGISVFDIDVLTTWTQSIRLQAKFSDGKDTLSFTKRLEPFFTRDIETIQVSLAGPAQKYKVNEEVAVEITSTYQAGEFHIMLYSRGKIVKHTYVTPSLSSHYVHKFTLDKTLAHQLSPKAKLVVWTVTTSNELLADAITFAVDATFLNEVGVSVTSQNSQTITVDPVTFKPGEESKVKVKATPFSKIGILAVDKSALALGSGDLDPDKMASVLESESSSYSCGQSYEPYYPYRPSPGMIDRKKRSMPYCPWCYFPSCGGSNTKEVFNNNDMMIGTDLYLHAEIITTIRPTYTYMMTTIFPWTTTNMPIPQPTMVGPPAGPTQPGIGQPGGRGPDFGDQDKQLAVVKRVRTNFVETWLWVDGVIPGSGEFVLTKNVPDTITTFMVTAFAMSPSTGFGMTQQPVEVRVFKAFFLTIDLPYSVKRGEQLEVKLTVQNYNNNDLFVRVTLEQSAEFEVSDSDGKKYQHARMWTDIIVGADDGETVSVWVKPNIIGNMAIEAKAQSTESSDAVKRMLLVEPEGAPQEMTLNVMAQPTREEDFSRDVLLQLPTDDLVQGSLRVDVTAIGDIMGPAMENLGGLLKMPYGCGEQNMLNFAPNIYIMNYLKASGQNNPTVEEKALKYTQTGYQRELNYQRYDGCFSAFGDSDPAGSTWLTAFVVRTFVEALEYLKDVGTQDIKTGLKCLMLKQSTRERGTDKGYFREDGIVRHKAMQGGSSSGITLTAYVFITLLETKPLISTFDSDTIRTYEQTLLYARDHLLAKLDDTQVQNDPYTLAIIGYALTLDNNPSSSRVFNLLMDLAINEDGQIYWKEQKIPEPTPLPGDIRPQRRWRPPYHKASSLKVEIASYALLMHVVLGKQLESLGIMSWLVAQRNPRGGYRTTQDTVMALNGLASLASLIYSDLTPNMEVSVINGAENMEFPQRITRQTQLLLQKLQLDMTEKEDNIITVKAQGQGTALIQITVKYNINALGDDTGIRMNVTSRQITPAVVQVDVCARYLRGGASGMIVYEAKPLSGYNFIGLDLDQLVNTISEVKRTEHKDGDGAVIYLDKIDRNGLCLGLKQERQKFVANLKEARAEVYSYYDTDDIDSGFYLPQDANTEVCDVCPTCCQAQDRPVLNFVFEEAVDISSARQQVVSMATIIMTLLVLVNFLY